MAKIEQIAVAEINSETETTGAHDPCSHLANAYRLKEHFGDDLLYVEGLGWHTWSPPWRFDDLGATRRAFALGKIIASEAVGMAEWVGAATSKDERDRRQQAMDRRFKWAGQSESANCIAASLHLAQPLFASKAETLDADPYLFGMPNGVLDLKTSRRREHRRTDMITKTAGCDFDNDAIAPTWEKFIAEVMADDAELIDYLQRLGGYVLSGVRGEHLMPIFWGGGANGKSTLLGAVLAMMGEYASGASPELLIQRSGNEHPTAMADLQGKRLVIVSESSEAGRLHEERVKFLTGGDVITARRMRMDFFTFKPTHQIFLQTNHKPPATGTDEGLWRRLRLVPFTVTIAADKRDALLPDKLKAELPGILKWAVDGWIRYRQQGFNLPAAIRNATSIYRDESDMLAAFLTEVCVVNAACTVMVAELYTAYVAWCSSNGERPKSQRIFGGRMTERGFIAGKSTAGRMRWRGVGLQSGVSGVSGLDLGISAQDNTILGGYSEIHSTNSTNSTLDDYRSASRGE